MEKDSFFKIQEMVRNEARQIATEVYNDLGTRFGVAKIPTHTHNGVDSNQIPAENLIQGNKYISSIAEDTTETVTIGGIFNPVKIIFSGFAANNADGTPATKRAILNGEIDFGNCLEFSDLTPPYVVTTSGTGKPFLQFSNSMYVDSTSLANNRVSSAFGAGASGNFIYSLDSASAVFASAQATSFNNQLGLLTIDFVVGTNVKIQGALVIT